MRARPARPEDLLAHADFVRGLARGLLFGEEGADDAVQDTWLAAVERPPREAGRERSWLATVLRNFVRQGRRAAARRRIREAAAARPEGVPSTADVLAREEQRRRVVEAVLALDAKKREAVLLRYYESLPPREIARRLGEPVETVRTRLKRALADLRVRLDEGRAGGRRAWAVALLPLAPRDGLAAGGIAMAATAKVGIGLATAAVVAAALWAWPREDSRPPPAAAAPPPAEGPAPAPETAVRTAPVPAGPRGPAFAGRVLDAISGEPIAGARVRGLDPATGAAIGESPVSADGAFSIPAPAGAFATLLAIAAGFETVERRGAATGVPLTLRARRLCALSVRVRDGRGDPIAGAELAAWRDGVPLEPVVTDAEGRAVLADLMPAAYLLGVFPPSSRPDLGEASDRPTLSPGERRDLEVALPEGTTCRCRIVDAETGVPIPGARAISARGMRFREWPVDAEGWFRGDHFPAGRPNLGAIVLVSADGYETVDHRFRPAEDREFTVPLRRATPHRFRVLGVDGAPAAGARVVALGTRRSPPVPVGEGTTDAGGLVALAGFSPDETHQYLISATAPEGRSRAFVDLPVGGPDGLRAVEAREGAVPLRLAPADRALSVRLRRGDGPAEGVRVRMGWVPAGREIHFQGRKGGPPRRPVLRSLLPTDALREGDTAPDGTLRFESLPPGTISVEVDGRDDRGWLASTRDGDATLDIDLDEGLPEKHEVRGVVRTREGPLKDAFVAFLDAEGRAGDGTVTHAEGSFRIESYRGPPTGLRVTILEPGGSHRFVDFPLPRSGEAADLLVE